MAKRGKSGCGELTSKGRRIRQRAVPKSGSMRTDPAMMAYKDLIAVGETLRQALDETGKCKNACFADPKTLARCSECRDALGTAALRYAEATRRFREAVVAPLKRQVCGSRAV